jgi:hypothetical protein
MILKKIQFPNLKNLLMPKVLKIHQICLTFKKLNNKTMSSLRYYLAIWDPKTI